MQILVRNVREAYKVGMELLRDYGKPEPSRAGNVLVINEPVTTIYTDPRERVLINKKRNANPFFHFFESIWMFSGIRDGSFLDRFVHDFTERFADPGTTILHGAYGYRWRNFFDFDQLEVIIKILRKDPTTRRAVLTMWDPQEDLGANQPDIPCNTHVYFRIFAGALEMMVNCRSNDIIWGAFGANAVHFSMLQEYLAKSIGVSVGRYYQNSWNFHAYEYIFHKLLPGVNDTTWCSPYEEYIHPLVDNPQTFLEECYNFVTKESPDINQKNSIFQDVAWPMLGAHDCVKHKLWGSALQACEEIKSDDWRRASIQWIQHKEELHESK